MIDAKIGPMTASNELFAGSISIRAMEQNPDPSQNVMCSVDLNCSGTATGFGHALAAAARAFVDSLPTEHRERAGANLLDGFFQTLYNGTQVAHGGLQS